MVLIFSIIVIKNVYHYQTSLQFKQIRRGSISDILIYSLPFAIIFGIFDHFIHYFFDDLCEKHYINLQKYQDRLARRKRCYTLVKWAYSILYYTIFTIYGYIILKNTSVLPFWLGGSGKCMNMYLNFPYIGQESSAMKLYYLLQFGKHFSRAFGHMFIRQQGNYYQYALHHGLSTFLIFYSFLMNYWIVGVFVLVLHDFSDLFLIMGRGYLEYRYKKTTPLIILSIAAALNWIFTRILVFCSCCIYPSFLGALYRIYEGTSPKQLEIIFFPSWFMVFMLIILEVLQLFWTYYILSSFLAFTVSQKIAKHTYD